MRESIQSRAAAIRQYLDDRTICPPMPPASTGTRSRRRSGTRRAC